MYDILSLSLYQSSVGNASAIILRASSLEPFMFSRNSPYCSSVGSGHPFSCK